MNQESLGRINYISGRYYAMDRDKRWDRVEKAYEALTLGEGLRAETYSQAIEKAYERGENDEFILPTVVGSLSLVSEGDSVIFFNFRPDRARELTRSFVDPSFHGFFRKKVVEDLTFVCMCQYDITLPNVMVAYPPEMLLNTLGEYLSANGKTQLRIAETEKYAHVTFFFNGGVEIPNPGEDRVLIPSPQVATYDLQPEMSAFLVRDRVLDELTEDNYDLIILNFANADMVGHTGKMDAAIKAIETLGLCVPPVVDKVLELGGEVLITADHGNAERMLDEEGNIVTSHSTNPVPIVHVAKNPKEIRVGGRLCDLAPTLLEMMGLPIPIEMTGTSLFKK
jgi:2,3-bisphosphoglycerate-independent phosphoglycerate mutase